MEKHHSIFVAGHQGMVGAAILRKLHAEGYYNLLLRPRSELDLRNAAEVQRFFETAAPEYVFLAAAKVGGIMANHTYKAEFLYDNLMIAANVIHAAYVYGVKKLCFLGSSCIYPKMSLQPIKEEYLLTGALEPTNEAYALAKIAGLKLCTFYREQYDCDFISLMPTNLFGVGDRYHLENAHVIPAMMRKFYEAKVQGKPQVVLWGTGRPMREFMDVDDFADACVFLMQHYSGPDCVNVGSGIEMTIADAAKHIANMVGFRGEIVWDPQKPDGTPRKKLDLTKLHQLGWRSRVGFEEGLQKAYKDFLARYANNEFFP